jgi:hypothetical protein
MNKTHTKTIGSRAEVWHGTANHTSGGLKKTNLMKNKAGRIVSSKKHATAKKDNRLVKHGYGTKKGKFGYVMLNGKHKKSKKKMKGGFSDFRPSLNGAPLTEEQQSMMDIGGQGMNVNPVSMNIMATNYSGGRRRRRRMKSKKGGYHSASTSLSPASAKWNGIDGQGMYVGSNLSGPETDAVNASGGRRRRRRKGSMSKSRRR